MGLLLLVFVAGLFTFALAMVWDAADRNRRTRHSDVAFWLYLVSAPLIVHPIFSSLGISQGVQSVSSSLIVLLLYVFLALISIAVDRQTIMVRALVYVVYAFSSLLDNYGMVSYGFAVTGLCIGATLLLLSAFWQVSRRSVLKLVPKKLQMHLPEPKAENLKLPSKKNQSISLWFFLVLLI
ncbi:MAG: SNF family Na+-dependent transporter [Paraglaciecola sp.]|jgi:SNF family Na+-dependent transporter